MSEIQKFGMMFDYLSAPQVSAEVLPALVFARHDLHLVHTVGALARVGTDFYISGGFGKDAGTLWDAGVPESEYIAHSAIDCGVPPQQIRGIDVKAVDGFDNARYGLQLIARDKIKHPAALAVAHAPSLRRLAATLKAEADRHHPQIKTVHRVGTGYPFNPRKPADQIEVASELMRIVDWPKHGLIAPQSELPDDDVIEFARSIVPETPMPPSRAAKAVLRKLPLSVRRKIILGAANK